MPDEILQEIVALGLAHYIALHLCKLNKNICNTGIHFTLLVSAISIVKYVYIFVKKNPSWQNDDFWCFFVNLNSAFLAGLSQVTFQFLPGRNPYIFYICSGQISDPNKPVKVNFPLQCSFLITILIYSVVLVKIKLYNSKILRSVAVLPITSNNLPLLKWDLR